MKKSKKTIVIVVSVIILALIVLQLSANRKKIVANKDVSTDLTYVSVGVAPIRMMALDDTLRLVGNLDVASEIDIPAEAAGKIISINAELGQVKSKGSVIAQIDDKMKKIAVQKATIDVQKRKKDLERVTNLYKGGSYTEQQMDDMQNLYDNAVIALEQAEKSLSETKIICPERGIITKKNVEAGEYVNLGALIATIVDVSKFKIKLNVSEMNAYLMKVGDKAIITTDIYPGVDIPGKISFISPKGDATHNYPVEIEIANNSKYPLKSGTFVNAEIPLPKMAESLYIPREALQGSINDAQVFVAVNGKAVLKNIIVDKGINTNNNFINVVSGLGVNDKVITKGQLNLTDGKSIRIIKE